MIQQPADEQTRHNRRRERKDRAIDDAALLRDLLFVLFHKSCQWSVIRCPLLLSRQLFVSASAINSRWKNNEQLTTDNGQSPSVTPQIVLRQLVEQRAARVAH